MEIVARPDGAVAPVGFLRRRCVAAASPLRRRCVAAASPLRRRCVACLLPYQISSPCLISRCEEHRLGDGLIFSQTDNPLWLRFGLTAMPSRLGSDPYSRAIAGGRGRAIAPARFARLIARARGRRRAHLVCRLNRGRSAPGRRGREAAPDAAYLEPIISRVFLLQTGNREILPKFHEHIVAPLCCPRKTEPSPAPDTAAGRWRARPADRRGLTRTARFGSVPGWNVRKIGRPPAAWRQ